MHNLVVVALFVVAASIDVPDCVVVSTGQFPQRFRHKRSRIGGKLLQRDAGTRLHNGARSWHGRRPRKQDVIIF